MAMSTVTAILVLVDLLMRRVVLPLVLSAGKSRKCRDSALGTRVPGGHSWIED